MAFDLTFTMVSLFDDSPQLQENRQDTSHFSLIGPFKKDITDTHKASAILAKRWPLVRGFVEVMRIEAVAQLGTYRHSPHEVRGDFFMADFSLPGQNIPQNVTTKSEVVFLQTAHADLCFYIRLRDALPHLSAS